METRKKITSRLTMRDRKRLVEFFRFEGRPFVRRVELLEALARLGMETTISSLLNADVLEVVLRGSVYRVTDLSGTFDELLPLLFEPGEAFYLGGVAAFHRLGLVDQIPSVYTVANTRRSGTRTVGGFRVLFRKRRRTFFYGLTKEGWMEPERAALDFCSEFGYERWWEGVTNRRNSFDLEKMRRYALRYPVNQTARRVLYGLTRLGAASPDDAQRIATRSMIALVEGQGRRGRIDKTWGIIVPES